MVEELAGYGVHSVNFRASGRVFVAQLLKVVLEDVDNFVGLQLALHARRHTIDESIEALAQTLVVLEGLSGLTNEIFGII